MATFLELCAATVRESGGSGRAPASVLNQTGRQEKIVEWVRGAWTMIQNLHPYWSFLRGEFDGALVAGQAVYTDASFSVERFSEWAVDVGEYQPLTIYDPAIGRRDENALRTIPYERFRVRWDRGVHDQTRPSEYAVAPDNSLRFGATPDDEYAVRGEYWKTPQVLAANTDVPDMPARFHYIIVWQAIRLMSMHDEAVPALNLANINFGEMKTQMERDLLPDFSVRSERPFA